MKKLEITIDTAGNMFNNSFIIKIDAANCTSLVDGSACLEHNVYDGWRYSNQRFESGKIYGLIGEYQQGCMYLSYLLGGRIDFGNLKIYCNDVEITRNDLKVNSWNLEPQKEHYKKAIVKKAIEKALKSSCLEENFSSIAEKFLLTPPRFDRRLFQLSGERWRASAALGYAERKKIFYAPYKTSEFYYNMCQSGLLKVLRELANSGAMVLLPVGSDDFMKHIADECIYIKQTYNIDSLKQLYLERFGNDNWIS